MAESSTFSRSGAISNNRFLHSCNWSFSAIEGIMQSFSLKYASNRRNTSEASSNEMPQAEASWCSSLPYRSDTQKIPPAHSLLEIFEEVPITPMA